MSSSLNNLSIGLNIVSTVAIVLLNKYIYSELGVHAMVLVTGLHFLMTSMVVRLSCAIGSFTYKECAYGDYLVVACCSCGSVAFMNLNLGNNSVGFYQASKLLCLPVTLMLQYLMEGVTVTWKRKLAIAVVLFGVGLATVSDFTLNYLGTVYALLAVLCTALAQIYTSTIQKRCQLSSLQLLYHTTPVISLGMFLMSPIFDEHGLGTLLEASNALNLTILTCILAVAVNVTNYFVIGQTSPITYQIMGHAKTILLLMIGFKLFTQQSLQQIVGIFIAMIGIAAYSQQKTKQK